MTLIKAFRMSGVSVQSVSVSGLDSDSVCLYVLWLIDVLMRHAGIQRAEDGFQHSC